MGQPQSSASHFDEFGLRDMSASGCLDLETYRIAVARKPAA